MDIIKKIERDKKNLEELTVKRNVLDEKIKKLEKKIEYNTLLLSQKKFNEMNDVIGSKGISVDEIIQAVQSGDLLSLQSKIEQNIENIHKQSLDNTEV